MGPGLPEHARHSLPEQIAGWKSITDAVHAAGGLIFLQIWHTGRVSHSSFQQGGALPVAPSAIAIDDGVAFTADGGPRRSRHLVRWRRPRSQAWSQSFGRLRPTP
ncbi:MAG: hypothetical protein QM658_06075 [Gordonia sp. (in: high G+C Gram-positive bacteria)]